MGRKIFMISAFAMFFVLSCGAFSIYAQNDEGHNLETLIREALEKNPQIKMAYNQWQAAEYKAVHVKGLPNPIASYGYFGENVETRVGPQEQKFGLAQKIPFPGKLDLKGKAQRSQAQVMKNKYEATKREIIKQVKFLYFDFYWVNRAIQTAEEEKALLENLEKVISRKYETSQASLREVTGVQIELSKIVNKISFLNQNRKSIQAQINRTLDRGRDVEIVSIEDVSLHPEFAYTLEELMVMAEESRQELSSANLTLEKAKHEKSLARLEYFPDFTFGMEYVDIKGGTTTRMDDGKDAWLAKVSVHVPIWFNKLNAQLNEKKANLDAAETNKKTWENTISYEVQDIYFKIDAYKNEVKLYQASIVPQAQQAFDSIRSAYITGKVDFLNWLEAERTFLQAKLGFYKSIADYHKSIAYLERIVGRDLSGGEHNEK